MKFLSIFLVLFFAANAFAANAFDEVQPKGFTEEQMDDMEKSNVSTANALPLLGFENLLPEATLENTTVIPFAEYDPAGYLLYSADFVFDSKEAKKRMAENLPADMTLVVFTEGKSASHLNKIESQFSQWIDTERLKVISLPNANRGFWARDGVPVPVWQENSEGERVFTVVDAKYYHSFEADQEIADYFDSELTSHSFYFEGGNFMANSLGDCVVVNNRGTRKIPDLIFQTQYGCETLLRLPFVKGIGHVDESFKFITDSVVVTDEPKYVSALEAAGFEVKMMPRPNRSFETYVNALLVNGVAFVPVFNQAGDEDALKVYEDLGFRAVPMPSVTLSNRGKGSIHCITMVYPPVPLPDLVEALQR